MNISNGKAFTLAEVLITLGIIGIVAAMTLPTLITNYKKKQTVAQLQKVYSVLSQALQRSEVDNGEYEYWEEPIAMGSAAYYKKYWHPYFKIMKICNNYKDCQYKGERPWFTIKGTPETLLFSHVQYRVPFLTSDGALISISIASGESSIRYNGIIVDLNGPKAPNAFGIDTFLFVMVPKRGIVPDGYELTPTQVNTRCHSNGFSCAAKIMQNGWEIKDDYPWR